MSFSVGGGGGDPVGGGIPGSATGQDDGFDFFQGAEDIGAQNLEDVAVAPQPSPTPGGGTGRGLDLPTSLNQSDARLTPFGPEVVGQDVPPSMAPRPTINPSGSPQAFAQEHPLSKKTLGELGLGSAESIFQSLLAGRSEEDAINAEIGDLLPLSTDVDPRFFAGPAPDPVVIGFIGEDPPFSAGPELREYCRGLFANLGVGAILVDPRCGAFFG